MKRDRIFGPAPVRLYMAVLASIFFVGGVHAAEQKSVGRGAPDPLHVDWIVGAEGKGMYTGAGVPDDLVAVVYIQIGRAHV